MIGYGISGTTHDFFCYNASGQVWNGSTFENWSDANYASYRVTATESGASGRFTGTAPTATDWYELRERGASLATSSIVWVENPTDVDGYTLQEAMRIAVAALAGKVSGGGTTTNTIRAADDSKARITATVDSSGNRTALTLDAT